MKIFKNITCLFIVGLTLSLSIACPGESPSDNSSENQDGGVPTEEAPDFERYKTTLIDYVKCYRSSVDSNEEFLQEFDSEVVDIYANYSVRGLNPLAEQVALELKIVGMLM